MRMSPDLSATLSALDWAVFAAVLGVTFFAVILGNRRRPRAGEEADMLDLLLMGRRLTLPLFTATLVATWYGGIFSVTEYAFQTGVYNWITQGVFWYAAYLVFAFALVKRIRRDSPRTMPELLGQMFGPRSARLGAVFNLFNVLPLTYVLSVGLFLQLLFGGPLLAWMLGGTVLVLAYSTFGGFRSVVFSDVIQFVVMCASVALVIVFSMTTYGGIGWLRQSPNIPAGHWKLGGEGIPLAGTLVWGFLALGTLVDPNFYHRCLAAKDTRTAKRGILIATGVWVLFDFCTTFGALYALAAIPGAEPKTAYLAYGLHVLPPGLRGFFLAGILATILSTLDSYLFLSGTIVAYDLAPKRWKGRVAFHHLGTVAMALVAIPLAWSLRDGPMVNLWKLVGGYATACLLFPVFAGYLFPGRIGDKAFVVSSLCGAALMTVFHLALPRLPETWQVVEPFYAGLAGTLGGLLAAGGFASKSLDRR